MLLSRRQQFVQQDCIDLMIIYGINFSFEGCRIVLLENQEARRLKSPSSFLFLLSSKLKLKTQSTKPRHYPRGKHCGKNTIDDEP